MCRYELSVNMKYGIFNMNLSDDYKTAINTYNKVKSEYEGIPCEIVVKDNGKPIFTKVNKDNSFDELYNKLLEVLVDMSQLQLKLSKEEESFEKVKNAMYHSLEEDDISNLTIEEQAYKLNEMKMTLCKRRLIEEENKKAYAFFNEFHKIYDVILDFEKNRKEMKRNMNASRFGEVYYNEPYKNKKARSKHLLEVLNKNK